ncbi:MAG: glycosyltransferase [Pirellulales bacterium]
MSTGDIVVIVTSFERPRSLARSLLSLSLQSSLDRLAEVVVADDGSRDESWNVVDHFARRSGLPVAYTTHVHAGFQPGRSRNEGAICSTAPYLAFLDGDCIVPPNFLAVHAERRRADAVLCGESLRLSQGESEKVTEDAIRQGNLLPLVGRLERRRFVRKSRRDRLYSFLRVPMRPRLTSNHFSMWRSDFERVDGFDLSFRGWGLEDCDLQRRLRQIGVRCKTVLPHTTGFHLWHPTVQSFVRRARNTANEIHYRKPVRSDGSAHVGLPAIDRAEFSIWRWREGTLIEQSLGNNCPPPLAAAG